MLSGRKVDAERGCALKAEMAKKNLHTKRGVSLSGDPSKMYAANTSFRRRSSAPDPIGIDQAYYKQTGDYVQSFDQASNYSAEFFPQTHSYVNQLTDLDTNADIFDPFAPADPCLDADLLNAADPADQYYPSDLAPSAEEYDSHLPPLFGSSQPSRGFSSVLYNSEALLSKSLGSMSIVDFSPENCSGRSSSFSYSPPVYPGADQNPPCNTLYVGNLPNEYCEDELRQLFQCCPGYKRLSFKVIL